MARAWRSGSAALGDEGREILLGLLAVQFLLGYEWAMSGVSKLLKGGFINALEDDVRFRSGAVPDWYKAFLDGLVIPNARFVGAFVVIGELFLGTALIAAALIWASRWAHLSTAGRTVLLSTIVVAGVVAILMNVNYHLYTGSNHPWLIAADPFAEGVDLDSLMPLAQAILAVVSLRMLLRLRHARSTQVTALSGPT
jgi:uncharacterized membrane protein YphA (DoxX/SURF4 family)